MGRLCYPTQASGQSPGSLARKDVTVQGGYGALFAVQVQILPKHYECRGTKLISETRICQIVTNVTKWHWCGVAVQVVLEPEFYHGAEF